MTVQVEAADDVVAAAPGTAGTASTAGTAGTALRGGPGRPGRYDTDELQRLFSPTSACTSDGRKP